MACLLIFTALVLTGIISLLMMPFVGSYAFIVMMAAFTTAVFVFSFCGERVE